VNAVVLPSFAEVESFAGRVTSIFSVAPTLRLDWSFPSLGVIDNLTYPLRGRGGFTEAEERLLRLCSLYLARVAGDVWRNFGCEVNITERNAGVTLHALSGPLLDGDGCALSVEAELRRLLQNLPQPVPVLGNFERYVAPSHNLVSLFGLGVVTGLSPFNEGNWSSVPLNDFKDMLDKALLFLAQRCVQRYEQLHPDEMTGQVGDFYLNGLLYPPTGMEERTPCLQSAKRILEQAISFGLSPQKLEPFFLNLAKSPDEHMSGIGYCLLAASQLTGTVPKISRELMAVGESVTPYAAQLRPAVMNVLNLERDWIAAEDHQAADETKLEAERAAGLLPWFYVSGAVLRLKSEYPRMRDALAALVVLDMDNSLKNFDDLVAEAPGVIEFRLQRMYLDQLRGDVERLERGVKALATEPGAEDEPRLWLLSGFTSLARGKIEDALRQLKHATGICRSSDPRYGECANAYGWALILGGDFQEAKIELERAAKFSTQPLTALLNLSFARQQLGSSEAAESAVFEAASLAPSERRVFANLLQRRGGITALLSDRQ
jgi:tetratricopeptide (TPR) repeat protein